MRTALTAGIGEFTLVGVAGQLGVPTSALYRVISSRDDLLRACLARVAKDSLPSFDALDGTWREAARSFAELFWRLLEDTRGLERVLLTVPWAFQAFAPAIASSCAALEAGGLPSAEAVVVVDFIADTVVATHLQVEAMRRTSPQEVSGTRADQAASGTTTDASPEAGRTASASGPGGAGGAGGEATTAVPGGWDEQAWLGRKIELIIAGTAAGLGPEV